MKGRKLLLKIGFVLCFSILTFVKGQTPIEFLKVNGISGAKQYLEILANALIGKENSPYFSDQLQIIPDKLKLFMIKPNLKADQEKRNAIKGLLQTNFSDESLRQISQTKGFNLILTMNLVKSLKELNDLINGNLREYILDINEQKTEEGYKAILAKIKGEFQSRPGNDDAKFDLISKIMEIADVEFIASDNPKINEYSDPKASYNVKIGQTTVPNYFFKKREKFSIALGGMGYEYGAEKKYVGPEVFEAIEAIKQTITSLAKSQDTRSQEDISLEALGIENSFSTLLTNAQSLSNLIYKKLKSDPSETSQTNLNKFLHKFVYVFMAYKGSLNSEETAIFNKIENSYSALIKPIKDAKAKGLVVPTASEMQAFLNLKNLLIDKLNALSELEIVTITSESDLGKIITYLQNIKFEEPKPAPEPTLSETQLLEKAIDDLISPKNADGTAVSISIYLNDNYDESGTPNIDKIKDFYNKVSEAVLAQKDSPVETMAIKKLLAPNLAKRAALKKALDDAFSGRGIPALNHQYEQKDSNATLLSDLKTKFNGVRRVLAGTLSEIAQILDSNKKKTNPNPDTLETQINSLLSIEIDPNNKAEEPFRNLVKAAIEDAQMYNYAKPTTKLTEALEKLFPKKEEVKPAESELPPPPKKLDTVTQKSSLETAIDDIISPKLDDGTSTTIKSYLNKGYKEAGIPDLKLIKDFYDKLSITALAKYDSPINSMTINGILIADKTGQRERLRAAIEDAFSGRGIPALKHQYAQGDENEAILADLNAKFDAIRKIIGGTLAEISQILTSNKNSDSPDPVVLDEQINKIIKVQNIADLQLDPANPNEEKYKNDIKIAIEDAKAFNYAKSTKNLNLALEKLFPQREEPKPAAQEIAPTPTPTPAPAPTASATQVATTPAAPQTPTPAAPVVEKTLEELISIALQASDNYKNANDVYKKATAKDKAAAKIAAKEAYDSKNNAFKDLVAKVKLTDKETVKNLRNQLILQKKNKERDILIDAYTAANKK